MEVCIIANKSTPDCCWIDVVNDEAEEASFLEHLFSNYPSANKYEVTQRLKVDLDHSLSWLRFRLRMAFFRFQSDRDPRELNVNPGRMAEVLKLLLPTQHGKKGTIYLLLNEAFDGLLKVGITRRNVSQRVSELTTTGVPSPFICFYSAIVQNPEELEHRILSIFNRHTKNREFFSTGTDLSWLLQVHQISENTPQDIYFSEGKHFDTVPLQGFNSSDYTAIDTRYDFFNPALAAEELQVLGLSKDVRFQISSDEPLLMLSKSGYAYLMEKRLERIRSKRNKRIGKEQKTPTYSKENGTVFTLQTTAIPRLMGEKLYASKQPELVVPDEYNPSKVSPFRRILEKYGLGDVPFYSKSFCIDCLCNLSDTLSLNGQKDFLTDERLSHLTLNRWGKKGIQLVKARLI
jgi:hypothetical protein